jgi:uncharacterized protein (TIGR02145 family)
MKSLPVLTLLIVSAIFYGCKKETVKETVTDMDGNVYTTIHIGNQVWMAENLKVTRYRNGDPIPKVTGQAEWQNTAGGAYCNYMNADSNATAFGHLYNWFAVNDTRGIAPPGWHIPTDDEWFELQYFLGDYTVAGGKMKKAGTDYWFSPNTGGNNSSGFGGMPGGIRESPGAYPNPFWGYRFFGFWWSATETPGNPLYASFRSLRHDSPFVGWTNTFKKDGLSVRCIKD